MSRFNHQTFLSTQKRLLAGTAVLALVLSGRMAMAQTPQAAIDALPVCEKSAQLKAGTTTFARLTAQNIAAATMTYGADENVVASFTVAPDQVIKSGLQFNGDVPTLKLTRTDRDDLIVGLEKGDMAWKQWSITLPHLLDETTGKFIDMVGIAVFLDSGKQTVYKNAASYQEYSKTSKMMVPKKSVSIRQNDEQLRPGDKLSAPLRPWIEGDPSGNFVVVISAIDDLGLPFEKQRKITLNYLKPNMVLTRQIVDTDINLLLAQQEEGKCRRYYSTGCFLTTAACDVVGLADDCWELRTLRRFRDGWLAQQAGGAADIARYYETAPKVVDAINARSEARAIWLSLYAKYIIPCALMAKAGMNKTARKRYTQMMDEMTTYLKTVQSFTRI